MQMPQPMQLPSAPTGVYPPAGGGYPPAGSGYPPAGGGYPPASGYPAAAGQYSSSAGSYPSAPGGYCQQPNAGYPLSGVHSTNYPPAPGAPSKTSSQYGSPNNQGPYGGFSYTQQSSAQVFQGSYKTIKVLTLLLKYNL